MRFDFLVPIFMASPAYPSMAFASTKETTNYARLCRLLVDVGSQALRDTFDKIHPPASLHGVLASRSVYSTLQLLRKRRILNATRWGKLYPAIPLSVSSADFDITLLILLLRNICGLPPPATGWDNLPSAKDTSIEADIARIKYYRNNVYGHASMASVDDRTFNVLWQKISNALVALGGASYGAPINKLKTDSMDPDIEEHYQELLKEWKKDDESTKDKLEGLEDKIEHMLSGMEREIISAFTEMYADLSYNIGNVLEEMKEIKYNLAASAAETLNKVSGDSDPTKTINQIHQLYTSREGWLAPFPWCEEFHFHLNDIFTRLVMVSREKKGRGTAKRNVVDMSTIFQPHEECPEPKKVLIEGKPGMGKTTYCNKIAYDWATGKRKEGDCFPDFELVLSLKCRDISIESNLWGAIDDQLLPREIQEDEREKFFKFIRQNQSNVLLVLDGLDELHTSKLPEFSEIIQGRLLPGCHLVVTARHEAGIPVRKVFDTLLEIEGFTEEDAKEFILKYFKAKENLAEKLLHQLENDENLQEMVANPLSTAILCLLCEDFQGIPEPRTLLYLEVVECVLRRYNKKNGLPVPDSEDLTEVYKGPLKHLGSVALNGLREGNMYFDGQQLGNYTTVIPGFGLLSVQPGSSKRRPCLCYGFLHKSFQELFAAFYICCQLLSKEISPGKLVADTRYFRELKPVLLFTCGILARQSEETAVALITSITEVNEVEDIAGTVVLECIKECKKEHSSFHGKLALIYLKDKNIALTPQQRYELQLMAGQRAVEQGPDKTKLHEEILTSEGTDWDLKVGAVHLRFPPNAVSEPTSIVVHKWKYGACSPPLQEHEAIVSNVIEISTITGQALEFNVEVKLFLSHSAPDLQGYEVVVKKQIDKESNEWEDVDGTEDLKCLQGIKDDIPPHKDILDMFFPVARVNITKCSTYAVVCRLKSSPPYTITSTGGSFSHPDYPGVTVTIPENAVAPEAKFPLELKAQKLQSHLSYMLYGYSSWTFCEFQGSKSIYYSFLRTRTK